MAASVAAQGKSKGFRVVDAPVSGGDVGAINATLSIMVGGEAGRRRRRHADPGVGRQDHRARRARPAPGQTVKAANQLIVAGTIELVAESIVFLEAYGVDMEAAIKVLAGGLAGNQILERKAANMLKREFAPGFRIDLHHKDMGIVTSAAREAGVAIPLGALTAQLVGAARADRPRRPRPLGPAAPRRAAVRPSVHPPHPPHPPARTTDMTKMRAIEAAVLILEKEGATQAFGLPGAAINPLYAAMRKLGTISHVLARHVEGAPHMAEGYTRAKAGNIGICIGTSGPAGTDMITGLYSAQADSIPILCITGQAPVARLHKEDFQAVDIAAIAAPVTKMAMTVLEPAQVPGAFQQAFHLMRSGRPGPVLLDLPFDVQMAEIDFDIDTYQPLPVYKPVATRAQAEKALDLLAGRRAPADRRRRRHRSTPTPRDLLVELAETLDVPVIPTLMGWGTIPDDHRLMAGMAACRPRTATATRPCWRPTSCSASATAGPTGTPAAWTSTAPAGSSCTSTSSRPRSAGSSRRTTRSSRTPRRRWSSWSRWPRSARRPATLGDRRRGSRPAPSASGPCCGVRTSTTCRSSRSGSTRR